MREIQGSSRQKHISFYRHGFCYVGHVKGLSAPRIARILDKDHSSVIYGYQRIAPLMQRFYETDETPQEYDLPSDTTPLKIRIRRSLPKIIELRDNLPADPRRTLDVLCRKTKADRSIILSDSNKIEAAFFRQVWLYLLREQGMPYADIAQLSGRVKSTAIHAVQKIGPILLTYEQEEHTKRVKSENERRELEVAISSSLCQK